MKKIAILGLGSIGRRHLRNVRNLIPEANIAVLRLVSNDSSIPEGADSVYFNLDEIVTFDPDAVIIASPASHHIEHIKAFLDRTRAIFVEKPLAVSANDLASLQKVIDRSKTRLIVGYILRFLPALNKIRNMLENEEIGTIRHANVEVGQYLPDWRVGTDYRRGVSAQKELGGGALLELSHEIDYACWLFGIPDSVYCHSSKLSNLEIDVEDTAHIHFYYDKGTKQVVTVQLDFLQRVPQMRLQIVGSEATLEADLIKGSIMLYSPKYPDGKQQELIKEKDGNSIYLMQFDYIFSEAFSEYQKQYNNLEFEIQASNIEQASRVMRIVDLCRESSSNGRKLKFNV